MFIGQTGNVIHFHTLANTVWLRISTRIKDGMGYVVSIIYVKTDNIPVVCITLKITTASLLCAFIAEYYQGFTLPPFLTPTVDAMYCDVVLLAISLCMERVYLNRVCLSYIFSIFSMDVGK